MRDVEATWQGAVLVCNNQRPEGAEKASCGVARGAALREHLKARSREAGLKGRVIVMQTSCLGVCSPLGVTVAVVPDPKSGHPRRMFVVEDGDDREAVFQRVLLALGQGG